VIGRAFVLWGSRESGGSCANEPAAAVDRVPGCLLGSLGSLGCRSLGC
jgi:hypothetical protein